MTAVLLIPGFLIPTMLPSVCCGYFPAALSSDLDSHSSAHAGAQSSESGSVWVVEEVWKKRIESQDYHLLRQLSLMCSLVLQGR